MPSVPTHMLVGMALGQGAEQRARSDWRFWLLAVVCSALPDADVIGLHFGIRYGDPWGHRGFTHSILFAFIIGAIAGVFLGENWAEKARNGVLLFLITCSHGALDAMTNGGLGVAFFSPFDATRYFFPWRPIQVSPIGMGRFVSARGLSILLNEVLIVWLPMILIGFLLYGLRKRFAKSQQERET